MATRTLLLLAMAALLLFSNSVLCIGDSPAKDSAAKSTEDDDEDISFLEEADESHASSHHHLPDFDKFEGGPVDEGFGDLSEFEDSEGDRDEYKAPVVDDKDVVVLKEGNFSDFVEKNRFVMVEFYAPWCGHCQALAPEYAAASTELKSENVVLAKVDATEEDELAQKYDVQGYPTIYFFSDGVHKAYPGQRTKDAIVSWIKKKIGPGIYNITSVEDAERILNSESKVAVGYLNSLVGSESDELAAASRLEDDVNFYQTVNPEVAKLFHIEASAKRPAFVLIKKETEKLSRFDGEFSKSAIAEFVFANKLPLVTKFTRESAPLIFESSIKKQLILFASSNDSERLIPIFEESAKSFKGKIIFVYVEIDNEDVGKPVSEYFGISGNDPQVLGYTGTEDSRKFVLDKEVTLENIKAFGENFLEDKLKPFYKSDPIPETNDGDVKIVVGDNFNEIVLDESKDVLLEIYAPWCGHCQALEPTYNKLAKHLHGIDSLVIAKMDGSTNEHPRAKSDGFPTILFFPAGNKSFDPITVETDRTVVAFYKFLKKNASIPFKLQKPVSSSEGKSGDDAKESPKSSSVSTTDVKDEL
ncbi:protein disulfide isomerase-like 1-4 isoform X3 [Cucurbita pepo subsp. pepo]|uniref:protein disulfide isomerase-like 1-4 isoform X1 n=1 Tax=Cucurbita pepo subsp. pepo TaxID=3664 RepID=UPI000C9D8DF9|nr:protein disulfide isomerase-like 1-4 isoform X1 [Cucurbita pepo subsp. pepo]XP_023522952.1 protein disulfide isomerase-like 1-4 isoform X2 [Cucurbita pepo subsp. pepo]XP_023522958.1 protein disulfide isomerase-like 1-4 isoform X3 [Cucurbita pepo subsp. pepo]